MAEKTHWFTVAHGEKFKAFAADLCVTAKANGVEIHVLDGEIEHVKKLKIEGILDTPDGYDRIAYLDADTLLVDPRGVDHVNGALKEPWGKGRVRLLEGRRKRAFERLLEASGLHELSCGGADEHQEWNSGVIIGGRDFMYALAREWSWWWDAVLDICDGEFIRDQISFKPAYTKVARLGYDYESIPPAWNCGVRRLGFMPDAHVLHKAGLFGGNIDWKWKAARQLILRGCYGTMATA